MRRDLADEPVGRLLAKLGPGRVAAEGTTLPKGTSRLDLGLRLRDIASKASGEGPSEVTADVAVTLEDRYGVPYRVTVGELPADGRAHTLTLDLERVAAAPAEPLTLIGMQLDMTQPIDKAEQHRFTVEELTATGVDGQKRTLPQPSSWKAKSRSDSIMVDPEGDAAPTRARVESSRPLTVSYGTGYVPREVAWNPFPFTVRLQVTQPATPEVTALATDRFLQSAGARTGQRVEVSFDGSTVPVRIVGSVRALPTAEDASATSGGALLVDLRSVNRVLEARYGESVTPSEWWLRAEPGSAARVAAQLRERPDVEPSQVVVRDEVADGLRDDPFGAGPQSAFAAAATVAAALAAVGFAVSTAGSLRERGTEFAILRALGAPRRQLARLIAAEQGVLVALALVVGVALGAVLTRAVIPLIVLTPRATQPVPQVLVELPLGQVAVLLTAVVVLPLLVTAVLALRRQDAASSLRSQGVSEVPAPRDSVTPQDEAAPHDKASSRNTTPHDKAAPRHTVAPWTRTRLRAAPGAAVALALLVALTASLAAVFPRAVDRYEDEGLRHAVEQATAQSSSVELSAPQPWGPISQGERESALRPDKLSEQYAQLLDLVRAPLVPDRDQSTYGVRNAEPLEAPERWLPRPSGLPAQMSLAAPNGLADHSKLREGRFPRTDGKVTAATAEVEAAVTTETAAKLRIKAGSVIHVPGVERAPLAVRITGIVAPRDPEGPYWTTQPLLRRPSLSRVPGSIGNEQTFWLGALLLAPEAAPALLGTPGNPVRYWQLAPHPASLTARDLSRLSSAVAALESGPDLLKVRNFTDPEADVATDLDDILTSYAELRSGISPSSPWPFSAPARSRRSSCSWRVASPPTAAAPNSPCSAPAAVPCAASWGGCSPRRPWSRFRRARSA